YPIGYFYGYKVAGVYQSQADIDASPKNTLATVTPGDLKFADVNGDGENSITKAVVQTFMSRFCLFEGTWRKYHGLNDAETYLKECKRVSAEVL
ncbi:hypothetical protein EI533_29265, partial [Pseudomonas donghuensis]|nr:hypothetical protein [Pseudomonas donghuensis]